MNGAVAKNNLPFGTCGPVPGGSYIHLRSGSSQIDLPCYKEGHMFVLYGSLRPTLR